MFGAMPETRIRTTRMIEARKKGTHTKEQWWRLKSRFGFKCVRCGLDEYKIIKDHIKPIYQGGSDHINNIQPLCGWCNLSKGPENFNWKKFREQFGWIRVGIKLAKTHPRNRNHQEGRST